MNFYNIYIEHDPLDNFYITVINDEQLSHLVSAYLNGEKTVTVKGVVRNINDPKKFLIYSITELEILGKEQSEIEKNLIKVKMQVNGGLMSQKIYSQFGTNVTDSFTKCKDWGSLKQTEVNPKYAINKKIKHGKIFISHSSENKEIVNKFCDLILGNGLNINTSEELFNTSLDGSKPKNGEDFRSRIKNELIDAKLVLQFISKDYRDSRVCLNEMGAAWVLSENVIPLIIEKDDYDVGFIHSTNQQCQLTSEEAILSLIDDLKERCIVENYKISRLAGKVKEFVSWLKSHSDNAPKSIVKTQKLVDVSTKVHIKAHEIIRVRNRNGIYLKKGVVYHLFPDEMTLKLMGYNKFPVSEISSIEFEELTKGADLQSINGADLIQERNSKQYWIILNNKRHGIPDMNTINYLVKKCSCNEPGVLDLKDFDRPQEDNLTSINKFVVSI